jgi:hypothetical protein
MLWYDAIILEDHNFLQVSKVLQIVGIKLVIAVIVNEVNIADCTI